MGGNVFLGEGIEVHFLGEELPDESVHVLIGAALPCRAGMGGMAVGRKFLGDAFVLAHSLPLSVVSI